MNELQQQRERIAAELKRPGCGQNRNRTRELLADLELVRRGIRVWALCETLADYMTVRP